VDPGESVIPRISMKCEPRFSLNGCLEVNRQTIALLIRESLKSSLHHRNVATFHKPIKKEIGLSEFITNDSTANNRPVLAL
jgi:hypothetical protein